MKKTISEQALIVAMARFYVYKKDATIKSTGERFQVSTKVASQYLNDELRFISPKLYGKVQAKKAENIIKSRSAFSKKECWLCKLFKRK